MDEAEKSGRGLRILLVDDNLDHARLAVRALRAEATWTTEVVRLGQECLHRAADESFDLILLDFRLPDMTGLEVLSRLRARDTDAQVLLMTSQGSEEIAMQALEAGAIAYVVKNAEFARRLVYEIEEWQRARAEARA